MVDTEEKPDIEVQDPNLLAVIRIRGKVGISKKHQYTLHLLNLYRQNHCTLVQLNPSMKGMIHKVKDYVTFGNPSAETIEKLLTKRGRITGNKELTDSFIRFSTVYKDKKTLAKALHDGKININEIKELKPIFRLSPPSGGWKRTVKKAYNSGGILGNVGNEINKYIEKMV